MSLIIINISYYSFSRLFFNNDMNYYILVDFIFNNIKYYLLMDYVFNNQLYIIIFLEDNNS